MRKTRFSFSGSSVLLLLMAASVFGQSWSWSDPNVDYSFDLPDAKWKVTVKPNATSPKSEFVYGDRRDGLLEIRTVNVQRGDTINDIISNDEQKHQQFMQGHVSGKTETFSGRLRGAIANFEYVAGGRNMSGRYYFLRANDSLVYVLRFTGPTDGLRSLRVQTDQIARSFKVNPS